MWLILFWITRNGFFKINIYDFSTSLRFDQNDIFWTGICVNRSIYTFNSVTEVFFFYVHALFYGLEAVNLKVWRKKETKRLGSTALIFS